MHGHLYRPVRMNRAPVAWAQASKANYEWLCKLGRSLAKEFKCRYGRTHAVAAKIQWFVNYAPNLPNLSFSDPPQSMPDIYKGENTIEAYRKLYIYDKCRFAKWAHSETPDWYLNENPNI